MTRQLSQLDPDQKRALLRRAAQAQRARRDQIEPERYRFERDPEYLRLREQIDGLDAMGLGNPLFILHEERTGGATTRIDGREMTNFFHYNYLGLHGHPDVDAAAIDAVRRHGTSTGGSRLAAGELGVHRELERELARFLGAEDAVVFLGGHAANESTIGHLMGPDDLVLHDALAHNSILQGALMSGAAMKAFAHLDWRDADRILAAGRADYRRVLVAIEVVYSAEGNIPELARFVELARRHRVNLFLDEAHSLGVLGATGRGLCEHAGVEPREVDILMGTLSKALGSAGGYIAGQRELIEYLRYTAPGFVYSVGMSPPNAAAALAALRVLQSEPERVDRLRARARLFRDEATRRGLDIGEPSVSTVVPVYVDPPDLCLRLAEALRERGVGAGPMIPPVVAPGTSRLRFFLSSAHGEQQIRDAVATVAETLAELRAR